MTEPSNPSSSDLVGEGAVFDGFHCRHGYPAGEYCPACGDLPGDSELRRSFAFDDFESEFDDDEADADAR